jgi:hypothetical protein
VCVRPEFLRPVDGTLDGSHSESLSAIAELSKVQRSKACTCHAYERYLSSGCAHAEARPAINKYMHKIKIRHVVGWRFDVRSVTS